jgi:HEAT repeat protein
MKVAPQTEELIPALTRALKDEAGGVRFLAATALGDIGPKARASVPALMEFLKEEDGEMRQAVVRALKKIDPEAARKAGPP